MDAKEQEFLKRLREMFRLEAEEHLRALSAGLIELEKTTESSKSMVIIETVFREAHSLKGAARSVNLKEIESICQPMESAFAAMKRQELNQSPALFDLFHQTLHALTQLVSGMEAERTSIDRARLRDLTRQLNEAVQGSTHPNGEPAATNRLIETTDPTIEPHAQPKPEVQIQKGSSLKEKPAGLSPTGESALSDTVRISISKLDPLLLQAEEMIQAKLAAAQRTADLREIEQELISLRTESSHWENQRFAQRQNLPDLINERLDALTGKVATVSKSIEQDQRVLKHMVDDHLEAMKQVLMLPGLTLVEGFPRFVRNLARSQGKDIDLVIHGAEIEIDKRILEEIKDPLIHLLRNSVDHGIEKPEVRVLQQKPARGTITLSFSTKTSRQVEILVSDDGVGIDVERVRKAAILSGLIEPDAAGNLDAHEIMALIFESGFSTNEIITDISGRGLGLAIVREKVEKLGGQVSVNAHPGIGTIFILQLPLTLATFRGILIRTRLQQFILPTAQVERVLRVRQNEIQTIENRETIQMDGQVLSMVRLGEVLGISSGSNNLKRQESAGEYVTLLILASSRSRIAVQVDEVISEEEVLVKGLGKQLSRVLNISGATVLGAGKVVPVINVADLMASALRPGVVFGVSPAAVETPVKVRRILVAEDSITARTLLKSILEAAGCQVTTAVDGMDAFTRLRSGNFDLVVSDVDMPRLSGFELTTKMREDKKLREIPVVLVTSLESSQDRERGIEAGANAYIVKSSFDQSNLLEVVRGLL
jgi:two-component system chemotaxis sensor kinase CheA